ncbi:MFS transporter [Asanoa iriomotensis]|uniref:MFS transporter n=1 Tax=Asanoa iriomotensis TaxID=234613 RepID=A0ABQ4C664_9ACTN|nr:MFS transporter [Asanoa iriomotensis]GIF57775.1 MFS transporter [Asanoa iriomotensis]
MLSSDFRFLWSASAISNIGDGVTMIAGPLLVASLTGDPALVAGAAFVQQLPWLFAPVAGAYVDRIDRRRVVVAANLARAAVMFGLAAAVWSSTATIPLIYAAFFLLGVGETVADPAYQAILPSIVADADLERANARLVATFTIGNQLAAKPLGAYLFVVGAAVPFGADALTFLVAGGLLALLRPVPGGPATARVPTTLRADVAEGLRALWHRPALRLLAVCLAVMNLLFCAAFAAFVLYAERRLGLTPVAYGVLLSVWALGGLLGAVVAARLRARFGAGLLLRAGLLIEIATHVVLATTRAPWVAAAVLVLFGVHTTVWGVVTMSIRQRLVPDAVRGRVASTYAMLDLGGAAIGTLIGGALAGVTSLTAPFWAAAAGMTVLAGLVWRHLTDRTLVAA